MTGGLAARIVQNPEEGLANATLYLDMVGHVVMGWMWLRITLAADQVAARDGDRPFLAGKHQAARYFYARELPRIHGWAATLTGNDLSAFDMRDSWF